MKSEYNKWKICKEGVGSRTRTIQKRETENEEEISENSGDKGNAEADSCHLMSQG